MRANLSALEMSIGHIIKCCTNVLFILLQVVQLQSVDTMLPNVLFRDVDSATEPAANVTGWSYKLFLI